MPQIRQAAAAALSPAIAQGLHDLVVLLDDTPQSQARLDLALALARRHGARLTGIQLDIHADFPHAVEDVLSAEARAMIAERHADALADGAAVFEQACDAAGVFAEWAAACGPYGDALGEIIARTRTADLVIAGQAAPDGLTEHLVLDAGRPVVVVPRSGAPAKFGRRVLIAWNGTREASRALNDALPLLARADRVMVLTMANTRTEDAPFVRDVRDIGAHLARHGVTASIRQSYVRTADIGAAILERARDLDADLLVMGAYGRTRLRERVLGGVTRHVLRHMTIPVLMSH